MKKVIILGVGPFYLRNNKS